MRVVSNLRFPFHPSVHACRQSGSALVEYAIVLPFILMLIFGGIEGARAFRYAQLISQVSREAANDAFRQCWEVLDNIASEPNEVSVCLRSALGSFEGELQDLLPGVIVVTKKWSCTQGGIPVVDFPAEPTNPALVPATQVSKHGHGGHGKHGGQSTQVIEQGAGSAPLGNNGRLSPQDFGWGSGDESHLVRLCVSQRAIVTAEVMLPYDPIVPFVAKLFTPQNGQLYAISIF